MRVIGGKLKGKLINNPTDKNTRPLKDMVRESIFNILEHSKLVKIQLYDSSILDLFSGVGTFGLECISRYSKHVTFFENHSAALKVLKKNIKNLKCESKTEVFNKDVFISNNLNVMHKNFEFIFLDPPFKEQRVKILLKTIADKKILKKNGIIIIHREKKNLDTFPENFKILIKKKYGKSKIYFGKFD